MRDDFAEALRWHLAPFQKPSLQHRPVPVDMHARDEEPDAFQYVRSGIVGDWGSIAQVLAYAVWDLHSFVTKATKDYLLLHAGAVARDGRVLLMPAEPDAGKSTTVTSLLSEGFAYLSDELGPIDPITGSVYPFEKRISLDPESLTHFPGLEERLTERTGLSALLPERYVRPEDVGATVGEPGPASLLVFLGRERGGPPRLEAITSAEAVVAMTPHIFNMPVYGADGIVLLSTSARDAKAYRLEGGSPRDRAAMLSDAFA